MAFDSVFQGPPSDTAAPGTAQSPSLGVDVVNRNLYISSGQGWQEIEASSVVPGDLDVSGDLTVNGNATFDGNVCVGPDGLVFPASTDGNTPRAALAMFDPGGDSPTTILAWSAPMPPLLYNDMQFAINNTYPFTANNISSYTYSGGVLTVTTKIPHSLLLNQTMIFFGYSGSLAPLNYNAVLNGVGNNLFTVSAIPTPTSFQITSTVSVPIPSIPSSGTDTSGSFACFPQIADFSINNDLYGVNGPANAGGSGTMCYNVGSGWHWEMNATSTSPPTGPQQYGYGFWDLDYNQILWLDGYDDSAVLAGPLTVPYTKAGIIYQATGGTALPSAATVGVGARAFVSDSTLTASGNFGAAYTGGGTHKVPVYSDGSIWLIG